MIKNFNQFVFESIEYNNIDILESLVTSTENLLKTIDAKEVNLFDTFKLNRDNFDADFTIEFLYDNNNFESSLDKMNMKKNIIQATDDYETFLENNYDIKFFCIFDINQSELDKPKYMIIQSKSKKENKWNPVRCYSVNQNMNKFYDELSTKTIELKSGNKQYIYWTDTSGREWTLKNIEDKTDKFKEVLTGEEIKKILIDTSIQLTLI